VSPKFMRDIARLARAKKSKLVVDTSGEALKTAVDEGVYLLKPNMNELRQLTGHDIEDEAAQEQAVKELIARDRCEIAILSLGAAGVLMATKDQVARLRAPSVPIQSRVGAGDSSVAGILAGLCRGYAIRDAVLYGVAAGSAAVMTPGSELCRRDDVERLWRDMRKDGGSR
jgi:6-phosphofructokinase 2